MPNATRERPAGPGAPRPRAAGAWPLLGLWTMHVWIYWFNTTTLRAVGSAAVPRWLGIYGVMTLVLLAAALAFRGPTSSERLGRVGRLDLPLAAAMCACTLSVLSFGLMRSGSGAWASSNITLAGLCMGCGYLRWGAVFANLGIRDAVACLFGSYLIGSSVKVALDAMPMEAGAALAFALPVVSLVSLRRCKGEPPAPEAGGGRGRGEPAAGARTSVAGSRRAARGEVLYSGAASFASLWRAAACVAAFCLARAVVSSAVGVGAGGLLLGHIVEVAFALGALGWVFALNKPLDFPQLWRFVYLFLITIVASECLLGDNLLASLCDCVATSLIVMLLWLFLSDVAHHSDRHPYLVFGLGWGLYVGPNYLGWLLARLFGTGSLGLETGVALLWATGVVMAFCLEARDPDVQRVFAELRPKVSPEEFASIDERCDRLAAERGLTAREADVLKLLAKGRSKSYIAETLFISENTVRGHARRLYAKLGVHTRDELQAMLGI